VVECGKAISIYHSESLKKLSSVSNQVAKMPIVVVRIFLRRTGFEPVLLIPMEPAYQPSYMTPALFNVSSRKLVSEGGASRAAVMGERGGIRRVLAWGLGHENVHLIYDRVPVLPLLFYASVG